MKCAKLQTLYLKGMCFQWNTPSNSLFTFTFIWSGVKTNERTHCGIKLRVHDCCEHNVDDWTY